MYQEDYIGLLSKICYSTFQG